MHTRAHTHARTQHRRNRVAAKPLRDNRGQHYPGPPGHQDPAGRLAVVNCWRLLQKSSEKFGSYRENTYLCCRIKNKAYGRNKSNNEAQRAGNGHQQTRVCSCPEDLETPPGTHSKTSRRNVELFTLDNHEGRSWEGYYLGNGLQDVCKTIS